MSGIFTDPLIFGGIYNANIQANKNTPLNLGQGNAPVPPPPSPPTGSITKPVLSGTPTSSSITVTFDVANVVGATSYSALFAPEGEILYAPLIATLVSGTIWSATASGLTASTNYVFLARAINTEGTLSSPLSDPISTAGGPPPPPEPPSPAPTVPSLSGKNSTTIIIEFDVASVVGATSYSALYGEEGQAIDNPITATSMSGTIWSATASGLTPETYYQFKSVATNDTGSTSSDPCNPIQTASAPTPPTGSITKPVVSGSPTSSSITVTFDVANVAGATSYSALVAPEGQSPSNPLIATLVSGTTYSATASGLTASTNYVFLGVATNADGTLSSPLSDPISTASEPPPPDPPLGLIPKPTVLGTPTTTSITVQFDVAGVTGATEYSANFGEEGQPPSTFLSATLVSGTIWSATASGLTPKTNYQFEGVASNSVGAVTSPLSDPISTAEIPPTPSALINEAVLTFLAIDGTGNWSINTSGNPDFGSMILTGVNAGTWSGTNGKAYLQAIQAKANTKLILSLGGSGMNAFLNLAFPNNTGAENLCDTIWNVLFGAGSPNSLNWSNLAWGSSPGLFFDGLDLDMEGAIGTGILAAFMDRWISNQATYLGDVGHKILAMAPQSPNTYLTSSPSTSVFTNNFVSVPFPSGIAPLSSLASGFVGSQALIAPPYLHAFDDVFVQCYNQGTDIYPGGANFNSVLAQWAYLIMRSRRQYPSSTTKLIWGFGSTDASPIWSSTTDATNLAINIAEITALVNIQLLADELAPCVSTDWSGGFGMWNSPSSFTPITNVYSSGSVLTPQLVGSVSILYANASGNDTKWNTNLPIIDNR